MHSAPTDGIKSTRHSAPSARRTQATRGAQETQSPSGGQRPSRVPSVPSHLVNAGVAGQPQLGIAIVVCHRQRHVHACRGVRAAPRLLHVGAPLGRDNRHRHQRGEALPADVGVDRASRSHLPEVVRVRLAVRARGRRDLQGCGQTKIRVWTN